MNEMPLPIESINEYDEWSARLTGIAGEPLEFCEGFPEIAKRHEAWWNQEVYDRPLFAGSVSTEATRKFGKDMDLFGSPDEWFEKKLSDLKAQRFIGDALPSIRVDFGPVLLGGLFGGATEIGSGTRWTHAFIDDDWSNAPGWSIDEDNELWRLLIKLTEMVAQDAPGRYLLRTPDLGGSGDVLLNLRGPGALCMDTLDKPGIVKEAVDAIYPAWRRAFTELYHIAMSKNAGIIHWIGLWSNTPYMIPACDFNYLIGPKEFNSIFQPDIARQTATAGRGLFHLDGMGAARHIDALLEIPEMRAIQYVPGAGHESAFPWIDMFRKIQDRGRSLVVHCPIAEVLEVADLLKPEGLCFIPYGNANIDAVFAEFQKKFS